MADDPQTPETDDDELLLTDKVEDQADDDHADDQSDDDEVETLSFGDDATEQDSDSSLVKHLRQQIKERDKRIAEVARTTPQPQKVEVGPKPTLAGCEYDEDKFEAELDRWKDRKTASENEEQQAVQAGEAEREAWTRELNRYSEGKAKLPFTDIEDAEETVKASLDTAQQAVLVMAADDPARLTYALGRNPAKLAELAAETNPLKLAAKIAKLEGQLKVVKGKRAIQPDSPERGSAKHSRQSPDKTLAKLEAEAERTGDRTKLVQYKKSLKEKPSR